MSLIGLFSELDSQPDLGVTNYGVSMTTLEDVFLRLEAETEVDQAGAYVANANGGTWRHKKNACAHVTLVSFRLQRV